jgi:hypothetical protein
VWVVRADVVADRLEQMRLSQTDAAVDEERVVRRAGGLRDRQCRLIREVVRLADDERVERVALVEVTLRSAAGAFHLGLIHRGQDDSARRHRRLGSPRRARLRQGLWRGRTLALGILQVEGLFRAKDEAHARGLAGDLCE